MEVSIGGRDYELSETLHSDELAPIFDDAWTASRVWYASCFMAERLVAFAADIHSPSAFDVAGGRSVIELGSGCGLVGLVAASLGGDVLLTDQREAVELLQRNAQQNMHTDDEKQRINVAEYRWGTPPAQGGLPRVTYDYIIVSDCINPIYGVESWRNLARSIHMLSDDATVTYLAHEARGGDEAMTDFQAFSTAFLLCEVVAQLPEKRLQLSSSSVGIFWGDVAVPQPATSSLNLSQLPTVRCSVATLRQPPQAVVPQKNENTISRSTLSLPDLRTPSATQLILPRDSTRDAPTHDSTMSLLTVLQTLWQSIAKETTAFTRQICDGQQGTTTKSSPPRVAGDKYLYQRYYSHGVYQEDSSYFLREREAAFYQQAARNHSNVKPHFATDERQTYAFDRRHSSSTSSRRRKAPTTTATTTTPTTTTAAKRDERNKMVENRLMDRHDHKMRHLLHVLQTEIASETQREIRGLNYWSPTRKPLSRQSRRHVADIVKERYEAADRIMRILEEYRIVIGVDAARYLQQTIVDGNRIANAK